MPDFLRTNGELTIGAIAELTKAKPDGRVPLDRRIRNVAPLDTAAGSDISFLDNAKYLNDFAATHAGACLVAPRFASSAPKGVAVLVTSEPYRAFVAVARALFPGALRPSSLFGVVAGHGAGAQIHGSARLEAGVTVDPLAVIGLRVWSPGRKGYV